MNEHDGAPDRSRGSELSLLDLAGIVWADRLLVAVFVAAGVALGAAAALIPPRSYLTRVSFVPEEGESARSGLAIAASQLGLQLGSGGQTWGPPLFIELLQSSTLLEAVALDSITIAQGAGPAVRVAVMDALEIEEPVTERRRELAVRKLRKMVAVREVRHTGIVEFSVKSPSPEMSHQLGDRLLTTLQEFHHDRRRTYAGAEREFAEQQLASAAAALMSAELALRQFLERNRVYTSSPTLMFEHDRLMRDVSLRQMLYTSLAQNLDQARMREVRNTPIISVLETPQRATLPERRGLGVKGVAGLLAGLLLGAAVAVVRQLTRAEEARSPAEADRMLRARRFAVRRAVAPSPE
jgi:uncharacterized protein involved in exopolysaccharide biosynthesis